jgi:hypothetical protein
MTIFFTAVFTEAYENVRIEKNNMQVHRAWGPVEVLSSELAWLDHGGAVRCKDYGNFLFETRLDILSRPC